MPLSTLDVKRTQNQRNLVATNPAMVKDHMSEIRWIPHELEVTEPRVSHEPRHDLALMSLVSQGYLDVSACTL
jgi:hypothetical protein